MTGTRKRIVVSMAAAVLAIGIGVYAVAQDRNTNDGPGSFMGRHGGPGGPGGFDGPGRFRGRGGPMMFLGRLNLTAAQRDQVKGIVDSHRDELQALGDRVSGAREALEAVINGGQLDEAAIRSRSAELATVEADMAVVRARMQAEIFGILTAEQQTQARQLQSQVKERAQNRRERVR